jgi:hypothetical protein
MIKQRLLRSANHTHAAAAGDRRAWERGALAAMVMLTLLLAFVNLPYSPRTWFDEGSHLHVPKTLVRDGVYADISSEGYRYFGPTTGVGPTVMLPIAAVFKLAGVGLLQGRLVISAYLLLAVATIYLLARELYGARLALLALALALAARTLHYEGLTEYGRQVIGEVPGVAFLLLGALAWVRGLKDVRRALLFSLLAGLGFGMALVTKNQFVLIVPPTLALLALLDWRYYRAGTWWLRLLPLLISCACFGAWTLIQLQFLGPGTFAANLEKNRQAAGGAIFVFDAGATLRAVKYLVQVYGGLLLPALAYGLWRCRARTPQALAELLALLLPALWLCWYVISLGWPRYAFPAVVFGALAVARLLADLYALLAARPRGASASWLLVAYTAAIIAVPTTLTAQAALSPDRSAQQIAAYLNTHLPTETLIETWEPELGVLTDHRYHYPPTELLDITVRHKWLGGPPLIYDGLAQQPPYVVVGPFGGWVNAYSAADLEQHYVPEYTTGPYTLYRRSAQ